MGSVGARAPRDHDETSCLVCVSGERRSWCRFQPQLRQRQKRSKSNAKPKESFANARPTRDGHAVQRRRCLHGLCHMWLSQVEFGSDGGEAISELAPRAYAGHVHAAVSEERARKGGQEDGQAMRVMFTHHVEEETRVKSAAMLLREFGRASQRRARWIFVEVLLALRAAARAGVGAAAHRLREVRPT